MSSTTPPFRFDGFTVDVDERTVTYRGHAVSLTPKAFQTLVLLLRNSGRVVEKEYFLNEVWADTFVEESTLAQNILTLRKALARFNGEREFIATVPRRGYQFVGKLDEQLAETVEPDEMIVLEKLTRTHVVTEHFGNHASPGDDASRLAIPPSRFVSANWFSLRNALSLGLLVVLAFVTGYVASKGFARTGPSAATLFKKFRLDPIVEDSDIRNSTISPNGKHLVMLQVKSGVQSLYVRQMDTGNTVEIVSRINGKFIGATVSALSEQVYYAVTESGASGKAPVSTLYRVSVLGGASHKILQNIDSPAAISSDEGQLAFVRRSPSDNATALFVADIDGSNERELARRPAVTGFTNSGVSWSPDGKLISATVAVRESDRSSVQVGVVDSTSGEQKILSNENWESAGQTVWLQDGSGIVTVAYGSKSPSLNDELWIVSYPTGSGRLVTNGINGNYGISLNAATNAVVAVESNKFACFLTAPVDNLFKNTHLLTTISDEVSLPFGADWTNDGKIVYSAIDSGNADIFMISQDGSQRTQLTSDPSAEISPRLSDDGRFLIFLSNRSGQMDVWRADANGTSTTQLTTNGHIQDSVISPDGETVFYLVLDPETQVETLWKVSINGEHAVRLTDRTTRSPSISPDGKTIAAYILNPGTTKMTLGLLASDTGALIRYMETPPNDEISFIDWSKDGEDLYAVLRREKPVSLWRLPISGGQPQELREWENDAIFRLAISRDGQRVFYEVGNELNSVVQLQSL